MKRHPCPTCGAKHDRPRAYRVPLTIALAVLFGTVQVLAALELDGLLSWALWALAGRNAFLVVMLVIGTAQLAAAQTQDDPSSQPGEPGLEPRYRVEKINDPTGKHAGCRYFVLDPQHDPVAREALRWYAGHTPHRALRRDLWDWIDGLAMPERNRS